MPDPWEKFFTRDEDVALTRAIADAQSQANQAALEHQQAIEKYGMNSAETTAAADRANRTAVRVRELELLANQTRRQREAESARYWQEISDRVRQNAKSLEKKKDNRRSNKADRLPSKEAIQHVEQARENKVAQITAQAERQVATETVDVVLKDIVVLAELENKSAGRTLFGLASTIAFADAWILYKRPLEGVSGVLHDLLVLSLALAALAGVIPAIYHSLAARELAIAGEETNTRGSPSLRALEAAARSRSARRKIAKIRGWWLLVAGLAIFLSVAFLMTVLRNAVPGS